MFFKCFSLVKSVNINTSFEEERFIESTNMVMSLKQSFFIDQIVELPSGKR